MLDEPRVRQRCDAAGLVDAGDDFFRRHTQARHEGGTSPPEPAVERLVAVGDVTARHERPRDPWPTDRDRPDRRGPVAGWRPSRARCRARRVSSMIWRTRSIRRRRCSARNARRRGECTSMKYPSTCTSAPSTTAVISMPGTSSTPGRRGCSRGGLIAGHRVVVGDAEDRDAGRRRARHELRRRAPAVRRGRVGVQIDQRGALTVAAFFGLRREPRRSRSARNSRISRLQVGTLFVGELQEDALPFRVLEPLAVPLEELVRPALAFDADEERLEIVDATPELLGAFGEQPARRALEEEKRRPRLELRIFGQKLAISGFERAQVFAFLGRQPLKHSAPARIAREARRALVELQPAALGRDGDAQSVAGEHQLGRAAVDGRRRRARAACLAGARRPARRSAPAQSFAPRRFPRAATRRPS